MMLFVMVEFSEGNLTKIVYIFKLIKEIMIKLLLQKLNN